MIIYWKLAVWRGCELSRTYHAKSFERFDITSFQEIILSSGVFRRETASGFYPWGNVVSPRKRVAEGLCGWRHGNRFQWRKAHSRTAKCEAFHVAPRLFFMFFVFDSIHNSATMHNHCPGIIHWTLIPLCWWWKNGHKFGGGCPKTYQEQRIWVNFHLVCYSYLTLYVVGIQLFCVYL